MYLGVVFGFLPCFYYLPYEATFMIPPQFMPPGSAKATVTKKTTAKAPKMGIPVKVTRKTVKKPSSKDC